MAIKQLGQITNEIVAEWAKRYDHRNDGYYCKECGSQIRQTTCHVSIHLKEFEPTCAGPGEVRRINYPFCPKCDGEIEYAQACYHISVISQRGLNETMRYLSKLLYPRQGDDLQ